MQLKEFSLVSLLIESGEVLKAIETAIPPETIEQVLGQTESRETRKRKLPSHLVTQVASYQNPGASDPEISAIVNDKLVVALRTTVNF